MTEKKESFKKYIIRFWIIFSVLLFFVFILFFSIAKGWMGFMPTFEELENPESLLASEIYSADNKIIGNYHLENRTQVSYDELPQHLVDALVATEDVRFYKHSGIDLRGVARMVKGIITGNTNLGGGSTISQQLAKMLFPREENQNKIQFAIRKLKEWVIAVKLERSYTKEEILVMYLNKYDYLNNAVGIRSASNVYFNTEPGSLNIEQAAMLVGMAKNSSLYNPLRREELVLKRRNVVFSQMEKYHLLNREMVDSLKNLPLELDYQKVDFKAGLAPYFREMLRMMLRANKPDKENYYSWQTQKYIEDSTAWENDPLYGWCNKNLKPDGTPYNIYKDGLKIYTTLDSRMQKYAEESVVWNLKDNLQPIFDSGLGNLKNPPFSDDMSKTEVNELLYLKVRQTSRYQALRRMGLDSLQIMSEFKKPVDMTIFSWKGEIDTTMSPLDSIKWDLRLFRSSFMAMEPHSGKIKAWVGGPDFNFIMYDMVKGEKRQVGSTVKPFLYTLAMQNGLTPCTKVPYVPQQITLPNGEPYEPEDSDVDEEMDGKMVTLKWGLANSKNRISAWVMKQYNPQAMADVMRKMGIYSPIDAVPSMFLGTSDITVYEIVGAFNTFSNKGVFVRPYFVSRIEDKYGNVLATFQPDKHEAINEQTAYLMLNLLQGVINEGTGIRLRNREVYGQFTMPIAGKTGTTQNHSDGWFVGSTPFLTGGVWTGADLRSIHFKNLTYGQGANMALPVWGYFMKKVLADKSLGYTENVDFEKPLNFNINLDCGEEGTERDDVDIDDFF
ncbi:MAG: transglycosylase domain-containing protein [Prolixibacteraceae bacterium]|nr:transglycosylase domain-containing protein [Prolixibacteraceae bacterium]MBN2775013.1 transglycosylase domain-containing protein [Prolixibacteraceae bacterium]